MEIVGSDDSTQHVGDDYQFIVTFYFLVMFNM